MDENKINTSNDEAEGVYTLRIDNSCQNVDVGVSSIIGKRESQQDSVRSDSNYFYSERKKMISVLCDGMGGLNGGERASALCTYVLYDAFHNKSDATPVPAFFRSTVQKADEAVRTMENENGEPLRNSGTTLVSVVIEEDNLYWASVGDSRIYIIRDKEILCITKDHNLMMLLKERVRRGEISQQEADSNPKKEALVSYIGMGGVRYIDMNSKPFQLLDGDRIIMCSDGLYRCITDGEIMRTIYRYGHDAQAAAEALTSLAQDKNLRDQDNTSVVVIEYQDSG